MLISRLLHLSSGVIREATQGCNVYEYLKNEKKSKMTVTRLQRWEYGDINELHDAHDNYSDNNCYDSDNNETVT